MIDQRILNGKIYLAFNGIFLVNIQRKLNNPIHKIGFEIHCRKFLLETFFMFFFEFYHFIYSNSAHAMKFCTQKKIMFLTVIHWTGFRACAKVKRIDCSVLGSQNKKITNSFILCNTDQKFVAVIQIFFKYSVFNTTRTFQC